MSFSMVNGITTIHLDAIGTLALALVLLLLGNYLRNHVSFLERFCIPAPVAGGFTFSFIHSFTAFFTWQGFCVLNLIRLISLLP